MMNSDSIIITSPRVGRSSGFIYCIYISDPMPIVYIGETAAKNGPLGRLSGHMQENGTFLQKCEKKSVDITKIKNNIVMLTVELNDYPDFCGEANKSNRRAIEYFVDMCMEEYSVADETTIPFDVVSKTKIAKRYALNSEYQKLGDEIARLFYSQLPFQ